MSTENNDSFSSFKYALGPGLLMAAAAVGVSHLVQSTRAGADFGFTLVWAVILANLFKYPFLEFGPRYAISTKESMIAGYKKLGKWALWVYGLFTFLTMFIIQAAVTIVTASLAAELTGISMNLFLWSFVVLFICVVTLSTGKYSILDSATKFFMVILTLSSVIALVVAFSSTGDSVKPLAPSVWTISGISFLIALMGWMPIPIDAGAWHSMWTLERIKQTGKTPSLKHVLLDFKIGYIGAAILALIFLSLGALIMFGSNVSFAASGAAFASQFVSIYTQTLGEWTYWIIIICAFTTMMSTTLAVTDAYPRVCREMVNVIKTNHSWDEKKVYRYFLILISSLSLFLLFILGSKFTLIVDLGTSLAFLTAPILAYLNFKLLFSKHTPKESQPPKWLWVLSILGLLFLVGFSLVFLYWRLSFS